MVHKADVSVIVPVYNKAAYLSECLDSILAQSLQSLEVICVDDASTDESSEILDQFVKNDSRLTVIRHVRNFGVATARNVGLAAAQGEFVQFTDADDLVPTDALRLLLAKARTDKVDVVRGGLVGFRTETPEQAHASEIPPALSRFRPLDHRMFWVPWWHQTYLLSRHFLSLRRINYPPLCSGEDPVFLAQVLTSVPRMSTISAVVYRHRLAGLEQKGRATYRHVRDYLRQADMIRSLFLGSHPSAWHSGFAPFVLPEIESMVKNMPMTNSERESAAAELLRVFAASGAAAVGQPRRKLLFMCNVCGLGGVETSIVNKMEGLRSLGVEARALFQSLWGEAGTVAARQPGFVVEEDEEAHRRFIGDWKPDAIVVVDAPWLIDVVGMTGVDCPVLFESHLSDRAALDWRVRGGVGDVRVSAVVVPSEFNRALVVELGAEPHRVRVIPNPVDPTRFRPNLGTDILAGLDLQTDRRLVLFVGRLEPAKNPLEFVQVCAELLRRDHDIHGVVVGDAVDTLEYAASVRAEALSTCPRFTFIERIAYDDMPLLYNAVAASGGCLVSTSLNESQPMIMLEAMACGCPVVASDVGGLREIVEEGRTGLLYPVGDTQAAVEAISRLINDREERGAVVKAAMDWVQAKHGLGAAAGAYVGVLDEVGARPGQVDALSHETSTAEPDEKPVEKAPLVTLTQRLTRLFSERLLVGVRQTVMPYHDLVAGLQLGFEASAAVDVEMRPKEDFSLSPDQCLNTLIIDYKGPSRWLSLEAALSWSELLGSQHYQFGLYGRPNRMVRCRVHLWLPRGDEAFEEFHLCDMVLPPGRRSAHGRGHFRRPDLFALEQARQPKVMFFFSSDTDLQMPLDYLTGYFA